MVYFSKNQLYIMEHFKCNFIKCKNEQRFRFQCWYFRLNFQVTHQTLLFEESNKIIFSIFFNRLC